MAARVAWTLNLDADLELAAAADYAPRQSVLRAMDRHVGPLAASLLDPDDMLVDDSSPEGAAKGLQGRAFCPTPRALSILRRAGAEPEPHAALAVLCLVNSRAFSQALGPTLPRAAFITDHAAAIETLRSDPGIADAWRVKRAFGMAGRGHRVVTRAERNLHFLSSWLTDGGVQIEPNVAIEHEYALHGLLRDSGTLEIGQIVRQRCDSQGAWLATEPIAQPDPALAGHLAEEVERVASALHSAGYFGPFGIDAFTYRDRGATLHLQPRSEINARYSMGFGIGFRRSRPIPTL